MKGYDRPLYLLPFDHRGSFQRELLGIDGVPTKEQVAVISDYKHVIYEGFLAALEGGVPATEAGILVDEEFGAEIARNARERDIALAMPAEKSGQDEFELQSEAWIRERRRRRLGGLSVHDVYLQERRSRDVESTCRRSSRDL